MKKHNLMSGALILSVGAVLSKVFSAVYRIALTRILGGVGIGLYQLIFPFYSLCVVLATAGLPMAISKVISKNKGNETLVLKKSLMFVLVVSLILSFVLLISSKGLATIQGQKQLSLCYIILAPTIIVVGVVSVLRGYFQGKHNFVPSAVSNIIEQFIKLIAGLILSLSLISLGIFPAIIGAIVGIVISEVVSLFVLLMYIKKEKIGKGATSRIFVKDILRDVLPITLNNLVLPVSTFVDSVLVVNLLSASFSSNVSVFLYGLESGAVSSLVTIPTIFSFSIASVILPNIANSKHGFNANAKLKMALKIILIITIPCVLSFILVPNRLIEFLYFNRLNAYGINGISIASKLLSVSSFGIVFLAINQLYSSCLQAVDERYIATRNLTIAVIMKFVLEVIFLPSKFLNIYSLAVANTVCYVLVMILNHLEIKLNFNFKIEYMFWAKLIFSNCVMLFVLISILAISNSFVNTILAFVCAGLIYFLCLIVTNIFSKRDKAMLKYRV